MDGIAYILLLLLAAALCFAEWALARLRPAWPGLVLPLLTFLISLLNVLSVRDTGSVSENVLVVLVTVLVGNIPTLVLLAIYWAAREKRRIKDQIDKMNIDDL